MAPSPQEGVRTFAHLWDRTVAAHPDRVFLVYRTDEGEMSAWTYSELDVAVNRVVGLLQAHSVGPGDSIHLCLRNCPAFIVVWLAAARLGAWFVPADPAAPSADIRKQLHRVSPALLMASQERIETYREGAVNSGSPLLVLHEDAQDLAEGGPLWHDPADPRKLTPPEPGDRLAVMFTSGTTSEPKGVELTQANYVSVAEHMARAAKLTPDVRWYVSLPLFHANAQYYCFAAAIAVGAGVGLAERFSSSRWLPIGADLGVTHASLFAAPIRMILARTPVDAEPLALNHVWYAQNLAPGHHEQFAHLVGTAPRQLYGMTETLAVVTYDDTDTPRADTIGTPIPDRTVRLVDPVTLEPVESGQSGMIAVRGVRGEDLFNGYLDDPATTHRAFHTQADGTDWFLTGDLASIDENGQWHFVGRIDDVVKVSGENVSLTEVEAAAAQAPGVLEVAVVAKPDLVRDVVPIAFVVPRSPSEPPSVEDLNAWAAQNLPPAARPREWHFLDELPRTSVGKIRRSAITF